MNRNIIIGVVGAFALYAFFALVALVSTLLGEGGTIFLSFVGMIYIGRLFYKELFVDVDDE